MSHDRTYTSTSYCTVADVRRTSGLNSTTDMSSDNITEFILDSEAEIDEYTGKFFTSVTITDEYHHGRPVEKSITGNTDEGVYYEPSRESHRQIMLNYYPVISITELLLIDDDGDTEDTLTENTDYHLWTDTGKIWIYTNKIGRNIHKKKVKVTYTTGTSSVPRRIKRLCEVLASIKALVGYMGGTYNDVTSYSLPEGINVSLGEPWTNLQRTLDNLVKERDRLFNVIGREIRTVIV